MSKTYEISYEVEATTSHEAVHWAVRRLREEVRLLSALAVVPLAPGWWKVTLRVSEDT